MNIRFGLIYVRELSNKRNGQKRNNQEIQEAKAKLIRDDSEWYLVASCTVVNGAEGEREREENRKKRVKSNQINFFSNIRRQQCSNNSIEFSRRFSICVFTFVSAPFPFPYRRSSRHLRLSGFLFGWNSISAITFHSTVHALPDTSTAVGIA